MPPRVHPSTNTSGRGLGAMTIVKIDQDHQERPFETCVGVVMLSGLCFASKHKQKCTFYVIFIKIVMRALRRKFEFDIRAHINFESLHDPRPPTKSIIDIYWHVFFSFLGFILPKSYQIYVFLHFLGCKTTFKILPDEKPVRTHEMVYHKYLIRILKIRD